MAIIEVKIKIACGEDISNKVMDEIEKEGFADAIATHLADKAESDNIAAEVVGLPSKGFA